MSSARLNRFMRRCGLVAIASITVGVAFAAESAAAAVFDPGETIGRFKVTGGHFRQGVESYAANFDLTDVVASQSNCYVFHYHDQGTSSHDLKFVRGEASRWKFKRSGYIGMGSEDLGVTGTVSRTFEQTVDTTRGTGYDKDSCDPPKPPRDKSPGCGTVNVNDIDSGLVLLPTRRGELSLEGENAMLWGGIFDFGEDPFLKCSSSSVFAVIALDASSRGGMRKLDRLRVGDELTLEGHKRVTFTDGTGFVSIGEWVSGTQTVHLDWALKVKRVQNRH